MYSLVKKAKQHNKEAFQQLMEEQGSAMYQVARAILKNDDDAADAMQETALACWEKIDTLKKEGYFRTWLMRILINNCNSIYRRRERMIAQADLPEPWFREDGYESAEWGLFLGCLTETYRTVVMFYYVQGFKTREIARILNVNENTVRGRLATARKILEEQYRGGAVQKAGEDVSGRRRSARSAKEQGKKIPEHVRERYRDTLSRLPDKPGDAARRTPMRRAGLLAAAAVLAVSAIGVSASVYMKWSRAFDEGMAATPEQRQELEENQMTSFIGQSVTRDDITVTAEQSIVDDYFALLTFRAEGYQLEEGEEPGFERYLLELGDDEHVNWSTSFYTSVIAENGERVTRMPGERLLEDDRLTYVMEDGSMEFMVTMFSDQKGIFFNLPIHVELGGLGVYSGKAMPVTAEKDGPWSFDWTLTGSKERRKFDLNVPLGESGATVTYAEMSPISVYMTYDFPRQEMMETAIDESGREYEYETYKEPPYLTGVRMKDGTLLTGIFGNGGIIGYQSKDSDVYEDLSGSSWIIDVDQVESLLFIKSPPEGDQPLTEKNLYIVPVQQAD